jgi:hypothetical protein
MLHGTDEYDNIHDVCAKLKYPSSEIRAAGFNGHLNLHRQRVNRSPSIQNEQH